MQSANQTSTADSYYGKKLTRAGLIKRQDPHHESGFGGNPLKMESDGTLKKWPEGYTEVNQFRQNLPVMKQIDLFLDAFYDTSAQVLIVSSPTGSGKSTSIPQVSLHVLREAGLSTSVLVTQPRQIAARGCANRLAVESGLDFGHDVGLQMRGDVQMPTAGLPSIVVQTDGYLLANLSSNPALDRYDVLIIDEIHELSINMIALLGVLKKVMLKRPHLKVILMSATSNNSDLINFYSDFGAQVLNFDGRTQIIHTYSRPRPSQDWMIEALQNLVTYFVKKKAHFPPGNFLVFTPGQRECHQFVEYCQLLKDQFPQEFRFTDFLVLYRDLSAAEVKVVLAPHTEQIEIDGKVKEVTYTKIIASTNVAETSVTIDDLVGVIDSGIKKTMIYHANVNAWEFIPITCSKAEMDQRKGRTGRTREGFYFPLYTNNWYASVPLFPPSPLLKTDITSLVLLILAMPNCSGIHDFAWFIKPKRSQLYRAIWNLLTLGFAQFDENKVLTLTEEGLLASKLPLEPHHAKLFLSCRGSGLEHEVMKMISLLENPPLQKVPLEEEKGSVLDALKKFGHDTSDHLSQLGIYNHWVAQVPRNMDSAFARKYILSYSVLKGVQGRVEELCKLWSTIFVDTPIKPLPHGIADRQDYSARLIQILLKAYGANVAIRVPQSSQATHVSQMKFVWRNIAESTVNLKSAVDLRLPKRGVLVSANHPQYLLYTKVTYAADEEIYYMDACTVLTRENMLDWDPTLEHRYVDIHNYIRPFTGGNETEGVDFALQSHILPNQPGEPESITTYTDFEDFKMPPLPF
ncbi:hypothetical protein I203_100569 [Kwoniella mangroviensis CBS 8507]|uniref:uncharacterized protein n=1 Tax=Kwoniella mangroviensis CBS 8507 TaxID=1296122 RepID=UPI0030418632